MSGAQIQIEAGGTFTRDPEYTLFSRAYEKRETYIAESIEIPFDRSRPEFGGTVSARLPPKGDIVRRITVRSTLPELYTPLGPGYVYPLYTDQVIGDVFVSPDTLAIAPGDFVGYFNTQYLNFWATNFTGYTMNVAYDSTTNKFVFRSTAYSNIFFKDDSSGVFWGFDPRTFDFVTPAGYKGYNLAGDTLVAPLTLVQAGWIRGFTPPPTTGFSYVDSVACRLVKTATLSIGGQTIDRLTSERLIIEDDLGVSYENQAALTILEGKNDPAGVYAPREYYTRLTFNMDTLPVTEMYRNDVRVDLEYEKFENLPSSYISSKGFLDGTSYVTSNLQAITADGTQNFMPEWAIGWKNYVIMGPLANNSFRLYNEDTKTFYRWTPGSGTLASISTNGGTIYGSTGGYLRKAVISDILTTSTTPWTTSTYNFFEGFPRTPYGDGKNEIGRIITDARYVYMFYYINYFTIGTTYTSLVSGTLAGDLHTWTLTYRFYNVSAPLSATNNVAMLNFLSTYATGYTTTTVVTNQPTTVTLTSPGTVSQLTLTFASAPSGVIVNNQVYNSGTPTQLTSYITGPIRVIAISGTTVTVQFGTQTVATIPLGTNVSFRLGPSISSQTTVGAYTSLAMSAYYTAVQNSGEGNIPGNAVHTNLMWLRYDTLAPFDSASSYTYSLTAQGLPASVKDVYPGIYDTVQITNTTYYFGPTFDGRYIYFPTGPIFIAKMDTFNFLSSSAYTQVNMAILNPPPIADADIGSAAWVSDGRYLYATSRSARGANGTFARYDSTKSIDQQSAWEYFTGDTAIRSNDYEFSIPGGFDGKYVYYNTRSTGKRPDFPITDFSRKTMWHKYDTTKPFGSASSWEWIDFRVGPTNNVVVTGSDGSNPAITMDAHRTDLASTNPAYNLLIGPLRFIIGARYIYIIEIGSGSGSISLSDFIQYNPVTMTPTLSSSLIIKYEKYEKPPVMPKILYGQTDLNTFTMRTGRAQDQFQLRFQGPVREFWVTVDSPGVVARLRLLFNGEVIVDDDQVTTRTIRAFEHHTTMPSSSNVCTYSFAIEPEKLAPSGSVNFSRIATPMLEVTLASAPVTDLSVRVYAKIFNVLANQNGLGGLLFNSAL